MVALGDFSSLLQGSGVGTTSSLGTLTLPASATSSTGVDGLLSASANTIGAAASGGPIAGAIAAVGAIVGLLNHHGVPDHERPDLNTIAAANDITSDQASWVCGFEESHVSDNYDTICAKAAHDTAYFQELVTKYNAAHPDAPVVGRTVQAGQQYVQLQAKVAQTFATTGTASPLANLSFAEAQTDAAAQGTNLTDYLTTRINSASTAATTATATATDAGILGSVTNHTLLYVGAGVGLLLVALILVLLLKKK